MWLDQLEYLYYRWWRVGDDVMPDLLYGGIRASFRSASNIGEPQYDLVVKIETDDQMAWLMTYGDASVVICRVNANQLDVTPLRSIDGGIYQEHVQVDDAGRQHLSATYRHKSLRDVVQDGALQFDLDPVGGRVGDDAANKRMSAFRDQLKEWAGIGDIGRRN